MYDMLQLINEMRRKPEKLLILSEYEHNCGPFKPYLEQNIFYKEYLSKFKTIEYETPDSLPGFDYQLFMQLVCGSLSSKSWLLFPDNDYLRVPELYLLVESGSKSHEEPISNFWSFQVLNIMDVFIIEQIQLQSLIYSYDFESSEILIKRSKLIENHNSTIEMVETNRLLSNSIFRKNQK